MLSFFFLQLRSLLFFLNIEFTLASSQRSIDYCAINHFYGSIEQTLALESIFLHLNHPENHNPQKQCCFSFIKSMKSLFFCPNCLFLIGWDCSFIRMFAWIDSLLLEIGFWAFMDPSLTLFFLNIKENNQIFPSFCSIFSFS